jgi:hypothetical protein
MKVAMVIAKVVDAMSSDLPTGEQAWELVSEHIEVIVKTDRLEAQGDTKNWRFSEVRRIEPKHGFPRGNVPCEVMALTGRGEEPVKDTESF